MLGHMRFRLDARPLEHLGYDKTRALLAYLMIEAAHAPLERTILAELLWPKNETARGNLRRTLHDLRQVLASPEQDTSEVEWFVASKQHIGFQNSHQCWLDVDAFMKQDSSISVNNEIPEQAIPLIEQQLALYRGEFLQGFSLPDAPGFEAWLTIQRTAMKHRATTLLRRLAQHQITLNRDTQALTTLERALTLDPCAEDIHCLLMQTLAHTGRITEALHQFDLCRIALKNEYNSEPSLKTLSLARSIRRGELAQPSERTSATRPRAGRQRVCVLVCELQVVPWQGDELEIDRLVENHGNLMDIVNNLNGYGVALYSNRFLAYFGLPHAQEQTARNAVEAALDLLQHAAITNSLKIRIGGYCGWLVNDPRFHLPDATGTVTQKAVALAQQAQWGQAIIGPMLARQVEGYFDLDGLQTFSDISGHIVRARRLTNHPMDALNYQVTPFVGRKVELQYLHECWKRACHGEIQTVLIRAEAGMGKSRLIRQFQEEILNTGNVCWVLRCLPEFSSTPFYPCVEFLERLLESLSEDNSPDHLNDSNGITHINSRKKTTSARLDHWLRFHAPDLNKHRDAYAELLHQPLSEAALSLPKEERRQRLDQALFDLFTFLALQSPTMFVVEDLHWADATSLEWLHRCLAQATAPGLLLMSVRPDFALPEGIPVLDLSPLHKKQALQLVHAISHNISASDAPFLEHILQRADGVPLYLEEMAKLVKKERPDEIPATLWNLIASQLESSEKAKRLAQQAAVIGRFFDPALLIALWDEPNENFEELLDQLYATGLIVGRGSETHFRHALFRDAAYETLIPVEKQQIHKRLVHLYETSFHSLIEHHPERLAQHLSAAGDSLTAARTWLKAGQLAAENAMYQEATIHLESGIALLHDLPDSEITEIQLQSALGNVWLARQGYGSESAKICFTRALELSRTSEDDPTLFQVMWGLWLGGRSCTPQAYPLELVHKLERIATSSGSPEHMMQVHYAYGNNLFWMARHDEALHHLQQAIDIGQTLPPALLIRAYGEDTRISSCSFLAWVHWIQGRPHTALALMDKTVEEARQLHHVNTLGFALTFSAMLHRFMLDPEKAAMRAHELAALSQRYHLALWLAVATGVEGWAHAAMGQSNGLKQTEAALNMARMAMSATEPTFCTLHVGALHALEMNAACVKQAEEALQVCDKHLDHYFAPELWRMRGEVLDRLGEQQASLDCLRQAMKLAASQGAYALEWRAGHALLNRIQSLPPQERAVLKNRLESIRTICPELSHQTP